MGWNKIRSCFLGCFGVQSKKKKVRFEDEIVAMQPTVAHNHSHDAPTNLNGIATDFEVLTEEDTQVQIHTTPSVNPSITDDTTNSAREEFLGLLLSPLMPALSVDSHLQAGIIVDNSDGTHDVDNDVAEASKQGVMTCNDNDNNGCATAKVEDACEDQSDSLPPSDDYRINGVQIFPIVPDITKNPEEYWFMFTCLTSQLKQTEDSDEKTTYRPRKFQDSSTINDFLLDTGYLGRSVVGTVSIAIQVNIEHDSVQQTPSNSPFLSSPPTYTPKEKEDYLFEYELHAFERNLCPCYECQPLRETNRNTWK